MKEPAVPWRGWIPALLFAAAIFALSSLPGDAMMPPPFRFADKLEHFLAYAGLGALVACRRGFAARMSGSRPSRWTAGGWAAASAGPLYGILDEIHQYYVPLRHFSFGDMAADALGALAGFFLLRRWDAGRRAATGAA